ncbi:hypothetical protein WA026_023505 [Henosepilachna vigintioctopunctata]|uniref:Uncharacterized protein n=1 Tax=Henosepilachna vigintioctopunctata TaxID=420089 RepID=A0AAW1U4U3_9CUCU
METSDEKWLVANNHEAWRTPPCLVAGRRNHLSYEYAMNQTEKLSDVLGNNWEALRKKVYTEQLSDGLWHMELNDCRRKLKVGPELYKLQESHKNCLLVRTLFEVNI